MGFCETIVDISTDGLKRNGTFVIAFGTSDFCTAQSAGNLCLDTLCAQAHGSADGLLHCTAEGDTILQIQCDLFSYQLCIHIRLLYFYDVDINLLVQHFFQLRTQFFDLCAATADNNARLCAVDVDSNLICETLDLDLRNTCCIQVLLDELTNVIIFYQRIAEVRLIRKPAGIPIFNDADTETVRINLLAHNSTSYWILLFFFQNNRDM